MKRKILTDDVIGGAEENGYLSFDLGYKHMVAAFTKDFADYDIFLFDIDSEDRLYNRINQIKLNVDEILKLTGKPSHVVIEEEVETNIEAMCIMYAMCMYFDMKRIKYNIQPARLKYKIFDGRDKKQFKNLSALYAGDMLDHIEIKYENYDSKPFQNHRWMTVELRNWLEEKNIDKADDIGDVVLILKYFSEHK